MMPAAVVLLTLLALAFLIGVIYLIAQATLLKSTTQALQGELKQFKEGGFDQLVQQRLRALEEKAGQEIHEAYAKIDDFHTQIGVVQQKIDALKHLETKVSELNDLLKPQQLRGELGEVIVRSVIADKLPRSHYEEDYVFSDGKRVEFAIRLDGKLIPVDSKFQLEAFKRMREAPEDRRQASRTEFKRTVKQKIDEVKDYIRPDEGTYPFALMVIPSEAVYYEIVAGKEFIEQGGLYDYARSQNVFLVSPITFWAYLTVIAQGLQGLEIGKRSEDILASLETIASHVQGFTSEEFRVLGEHLRNAKSKYDDAHEKLQELGSELTALKRLKAEQPTEQGATA